QSTNVELTDVVLELQVQPLVNSENEVTLEISLVRDSVGQDRNVGELIIPDINTDELTTTVTVPNGAAIILGGLITTQEGQTKSGVPILSRIPGLGRLFGSTEDDDTRSELVIILRPEIISDSLDMGTYRTNFENHSGVARDARLSLPPTSSGMLPAPGVMDAPEEGGKSGGAKRAPVVAPAPAEPKRKSSRVMNFQRRR
ncbi:MAG: type II secretion system protein GspD, partial [Verrucomicrobiales bacterium]